MVTAAQILENNGLEVVINNFDVAVDVVDTDNVQVYVVSHYGDVYSKNIFGANAAEKAADFVNKKVN